MSFGLSVAIGSPRGRREVLNTGVSLATRQNCAAVSAEPGPGSTAVTQPSQTRCLPLQPGDSSGWTSRLDLLQVEQKTPPQTRQWCLRRIVPKDLEQRGQALASLSGTKWSTQPYHFLPPGEPVLPTLAGEPTLSTLVVLTMLPTEASLMAGLPTSSSMGDGGSRMGFSCTHPARL